MDWSITHSLNGFFFHHDAVEDPLLAYSNVSEALFAAILVLVFVAARGIRHGSWRHAAAVAGLSAGLALAAGKLISTAWTRQRPFVSHPRGLHLFAKHAADASFPSDHATAAFAIGVAIVLRKRRWGIAALLLAALLAATRVALGLHYPTDVLGGAALGTLAALILWFPPLRMRLHALADAIGSRIDRLLGSGAARVGIGPHRAD